ncbi:MAG: RsmB/NOP family class I SAM-dependent RNA methyltransferase [Candidatus Hodarchaeales archaeon]|jgi:16S rRNA (cytosine967-C5)-methyltransferase
MDLLGLIRKWIHVSNNPEIHTLKSTLIPTNQHYLREIIRYWNKIQYITRKTLRSLSREEDKKLRTRKLELFFYITYRSLWEKASLTSILNELKDEYDGLGKENLKDFYSKLASFNFDIALENKSEIEQISIRYAIPSFTIRKLLPVLDITRIKNNIVAMDNRARKGTLYLRINVGQDDIESLVDLSSTIRREFSQVGVTLHHDNDVPFLLKARAMDKSKVIKSDFYQQKVLIFQDKASIAPVIALSPKSNDLICDLCAAPGMKTSLISQQSSGKSRVIAGDFHKRRTQEMVRFLSDLELKNLNLVRWDGLNPPLQLERFDKILLDAPCTGSGTFTNNPELKWRQNERFLKRFIHLQEQLLLSAFSLLKIGGTLVYSTCSLYPEEGEYQIQKIKSDKVRLEEIPSWIPTSFNINGLSQKGTGRFLPAEHDTNGFFLAKLTKLS